MAKERAARAVPAVLGRRRLRLAALLLAPVLAASGCGGAESGAGAPESAASVIDRLAAAGIGVFDDPADATPIVPPAEPASPVRLLESQVRTLAAEADSRAGFAAKDLDVMVGEQQKIGGRSLTSSRLIAGWARHGDTAAAGYARDILGGTVDLPQDAVFPKLVLLLFTADIATAGASLPGPRGGSSPMSGPAHAASAAAAPSVASTPCSSLVNWVDGIIAKVFNAIGHLQLEVRTGIGGIFDRIVNTLAKVVADGVNVVIDGVHFVINKTVRALIVPVLSFVGRVAGIVGTIAQVASFLRPWSPSLTATPKRNQKAIRPAAGTPGDFTLHIDLGGLDEWPSALADCATVAGTPLPPLRPRGNPVTWEVASHDLITIEDKDTVLREDATAIAHYRTTQEGTYKKATEQTGLVIASATVRRDDATELRKSFVKLLDDALAHLLPPIVDDIVKPHLKDLVRLADKAFDKLEHLRDEKAIAVLPVTYHVPDEEEPDPSAPPTGGGAGCTDRAGSVAPGTYQGAFNARQKIDFGERTFTGKISFTVGASGKLVGTFALTYTVTSGGVPTEVWHTVDGRLSGSVTRPTAAASWDWGGDVRWPLTIDRMPAFTGSCGTVRGSLTGTFHSGLDHPDATEAAETMPEHLAKGGVFAARTVG